MQTWNYNTNIIVPCIKERKALREKCPHSEIFWFTFSRIRTEYDEILRTSPYSVQMRENADQNNSEYEQFLRSEVQTYFKIHEKWKSIIKGR